MSLQPLRKIMEVTLTLWNVLVFTEVVRTVRLTALRAGAPPVGHTG